MVTAYQAAVSGTPDYSGLLNEQREWLKQRDRCNNAECLAKNYRERIDALQARQHADAREAAVAYNAGDLSKACDLLNSNALIQNGGGDYERTSFQACELRSVKQLGELAGRNWYVADFCLTQPGTDEPGCIDKSQLGAFDVSAALVFVRELPDGPLYLRVKHYFDYSGHFAGAEIYRNKSGALLDIAGFIDGTGNVNVGRYFVYRNGKWRMIDSWTWEKDLQKRLPKGFGIWKGLRPDLRKMVCDSPVWKEGDANCCPTGGETHMTLTLMGEKLSISSFSYKKHR